MALVAIPHLGRIDSDSLEEYYDAEIEFNNTQLQVDLNFEKKTIEPARLEIVKSFIENIRIHDLNNKRLINKDYSDEEGDTVKVYLQHHLEELGQDELASLINVNSKSTMHEQQLLQKLHLVRVGIYPDSESQFAMFDYSLGIDLTNYLVVLFTDHNGNLDYMTMES